MLEVEPTAKLVETGACISFYHHHGDIALRVRFRGGGGNVLHSSQAPVGCWVD